MIPRYRLRVDGRLSGLVFDGRDGLDCALAAERYLRGQGYDVELVLVPAPWWAVAA